MADIEVYKAEIQRSFALVEPIATEAAAIFYATLFEVNPETKPLFEHTDMDKQGEKLMKVLKLAVATLNNMDKLVRILQELGRKHVSYGVKANMYPSVAEALLLTLEKGLGDECTPETKEAWGWVLKAISDICIGAVKEIDPTYGDETVAKDVKAEVEVPVTPETSEPERAPAAAQPERVEVR